MSRHTYHLVITFPRWVRPVAIALFSVVFVLVSTGWTSVFEHWAKAPQPGRTQAAYQFGPTGGAIITGTQPNGTVNQATTAEGANIGSWRGALAADNYHWGITSTTGGYEAYLDVDHVELNGANKIMIQTDIDLDATVPVTLVQVCDWVDSTGVSAAADAQCTGGGWRNLNLNDEPIDATSGTLIEYDWQIYDGYWSADATTAIATPLTNFVNSASDSKVRIRYISTTNTTSTVHIDYLRVTPIVSPMYTPSGAVQISGGTVSGDYTSTISTSGLSSGQTGFDAVEFNVPGVLGSAYADFYFAYNNVKTYEGANTILLRTRYTCSVNSGTRIIPKIYNFTTASWEDLAVSAPCQLTARTETWAKNNVDLNNYVSGGQVRVGYEADVQTNTELGIDVAYIMVGSTNADAGASEVSFGSVTANTAAATRDISTSDTASAWQFTAADESNTFASSFYPYDNDADAVTEEAAAANIDFPVIPPSGTATVGIFYAGAYATGVSGYNMRLGVRNYSGTQNGTAEGGWTVLGPAPQSAVPPTYLYHDGFMFTGVSQNVSTGSSGMYLDAEDHIDIANGEMNLRLRTTTAGSTANNAETYWDFAMVSIAWIEDSAAPSTQYEFTPNSATLVTGTALDIQAATGPSVEGVNTGSWRALLADDNFHWGFASTASGYEAYVDVPGVELNGANSLFIQTEIDIDATAPATLVQVCDWVSSTGVSSAADANCTGGGWRTLNTEGAAINSTTASQYGWQVHDGYWNANATTPISTPLTNFISGSGGVRIRYVSTTNTTSSVYIDFLRVSGVIHPIYWPSRLTQISGGTIIGDYTQASGPSAGQLGSNNSRLRVPGTATDASDFYFTFDEVHTYEGANTILVRGEYSCSATGISHRPKIYNFSSESWEDLTTESIPCATTDSVPSGAFAKNNVNLNNYISGGEVRVGWYGLSPSETELRIDLMYIIVGSTNTDGAGEISLGTSAGNSVTATRDIDTAATASTWSIASANENSVTSGFYAYDSDLDATAEEASAANITFSVTPPDSTFVTGVIYGARFMSGAAGNVQIGLRDYGARTNNQGGWTGPSAFDSGTTVLNYTDNVTVDDLRSAGLLGFYLNPQEHINTTNNTANLRLRTWSAGAATNNSVAQWDFAMVSIAWIEIAVAEGLTFTAETNPFPVLTPGTPAFATTTLAVTGTSATGWNVSAYGNDRTTGNTVLDLDADAAIGITDQAEWIPGAATTTAGNAVRISSLDTSGDVLAFRVMTASGTSSFRAPNWWGSVDSFLDDASTLWAGFASSTATSKTIGQSTENLGGGTALNTVQYYLDVPQTQPTGTYSGAVTYTAIANP